MRILNLSTSINFVRRRMKGTYFSSSLDELVSVKLTLARHFFSMKSFIINIKQMEFLTLFGCHLCFQFLLFLPFSSGYFLASFVQYFVIFFIVNVLFSLYKIYFFLIRQDRTSGLVALVIKNIITKKYQKSFRFFSSF